MAEALCGSLKDSPYHQTSRNVMNLINIKNKLRRQLYRMYDLDYTQRRISIKQEWKDLRIHKQRKFLNTFLKELTLHYS